MKRAMIFSAFMLASAFSFAQLFPKVDKPTSEDMSMLVVQFAKDTDGKMEIVSNMNFTGWAPVVEGPDGKIVPFRNFDAGADMTNIYYSENLPAGTYTLKGFNHLYTNYTKLDEYKAQTGEELARYAPYENLPYHEVQFFPISQPVVVELIPNKMMSLGSLGVQYKWISGAAGTTDDRWKAVEDFSKITMEKPLDDYVLRYMKSWATPKWKKWNAKNPATAL